MTLNNNPVMPIYKPVTQPQLFMGNMINRINGVKAGCGSCGK